MSNELKIPQQIGFAEVTGEYAQFVEKFKPKKTTDDCYTPDNIYSVVLDWVCNTYGVDPDSVVRPFWPGGDYERFPYKQDSVVLDNPPFSMISKIVKFYNDYKVRYFLFAPHLTNFSNGKNCCHVIECCPITYENGAVVSTSFLTNLDDRLVVADPELYKQIKAANEENTKSKREIPKYEYPDNVVTAAMIGYIVTKGIPYELERDEAVFIRELDAQKAVGKAIFGGGFLVSEKAAAEKAAAEKWRLSDRERRIVEALK